MKKIVLLILFVMGISLTSNAQPQIKKITKSLFTLKTYGKDGTVKSTSHGLFIGKNGEAVGLWSAFTDAERAIVTDVDGREMDVECIMGANELYDVCKFKVKGNTVAAEYSPQPAKQNDKVWLINTSESKPSPLPYTVSKAETFSNKYNYYVLPSDDNMPGESGYAIVNSQGMVIGITQNSNTPGEIHAVDTKFIDDLKIEGLSISEPIFRKTGILLDMPKDKEQALIMLVMAKELNDSAKYIGYINDFVERFPKDVDGYAARAMTNMSQQKYEDADNDMKLAIEKATDKAEAHSEYSRVMYQKIVYEPDSTFTHWTLDNALDEIHKAIAINPMPVYKHREAQIIFSQGNYKDAYDRFIGLTKEKLNREELFFEAAQCKTQLAAPDQEIIVLLDSAINACQKPLNALAAPYILSRGQLYDKIGEYRKAMSDYNTYDTLMVGRANDVFYYTRYLCALNTKQFQQALNDIAHAAYINPYQPTYMAELASLQLRFNQLDNAIKSATMCINIAPEYADGYIIRGIALMHNKDKEKGMEDLLKAKELGDARADELINKYK